MGKQDWEGVWYCLWDLLLGWPEASTSSSSKRLSCWAEAGHCGGHTICLSRWQGHGRAATLTLFCGSLLWSLLHGKHWLGEKPDYIKHLTWSLCCLEAQNYDRSEETSTVKDFQRRLHLRRYPMLGEPSEGICNESGGSSQLSRHPLFLTCWWNRVTCQSRSTAQCTPPLP